MNKRKPNKQLEQEYNEAGAHCFYCKTETLFEDITRDHIKPKSEGYILNSGNKVFACRDCNTLKDNLNLESFRVKIMRLIKKTLKQKTNGVYGVSKKNIIKFRKYLNIIDTVDVIRLQIN